MVVASGISSLIRSSLHFNPFLANVPILYPLKTPENQRFSGVFRRSKKGTLARNGLSLVSIGQYRVKGLINYFLKTTYYHPAGSYIFNINNTNTITRCEICSNLTIGALVVLNFKILHC